VKVPQFNNAGKVYVTLKASVNWRHSESQYELQPEVNIGWPIGKGNDKFVFPILSEQTSPARYVTPNIRAYNSLSVKKNITVILGGKFYSVLEFGQLRSVVYSQLLFLASAIE